MIYHFEKYQLDDETYELRAGSDLRKLPRKSFDLLRYLLQNSTRVVSKTELFREIWPGEHVTESVLPVNVRTIRKALGDEGSEAILKTVRGRGYRIACSVERLEGSGAEREPVEGRSGFVGRAGLMASLRKDYEAAVEGRGRIVLLYGEDGTGKTRVLDEFAHWARRRSALVLSVRCPDDPGAPPFWPVTQLLRGGLEALATEEFSGLVKRRDYDLDRARTRISGFLRSHFSGPVDSAARFRITQTAVYVVKRVSELVPLVLVLDDVHHADEGTLRVCEAVTREIPNHAVMSLAAYSDSELRRGSALSTVMGAISSQDSLRHVQLRGLERDDIDAFVREEIGLEPPADLVSALYERTEGNPFFLRETLRLLVAEGGVQMGLASALAHLGLPQGIREAVRRRLDRLSSECNRVLSWASVIGQPFAFPVLERVCGLANCRILELLAEAEEAHVLSSTPPGKSEARLVLGEFRFAHGLIRQTIYEGISGPERVLRHRAVAEALDALYGSAPGERVFELAHHFFEAAPGGDIQRAVDYGLRSACHASRRFDYEDALRHFDQAVRAEELRVPRDDLRYCCVSMARADALWRAGRYPAAQAEFLRTAELARGLERFDLVGRCVLGLMGWPRFNRVSFLTGTSAIERGRVVALAREAQRGLGDENLALRSRLMAVRARIADPSAESEEMADKAMELARASNDGPAVLHAWMAKVGSLAGPSRVGRALECASEAVALARQLGSAPRLFAAYEARIPLLFTVGDMELADADIAAASQIAGQMRTVACAYALARFRLARALGSGDLSRAGELIARVVKLGEKSGDEGAVWAARAARFWMLTAQGRSEPFHEALDALPVDANEPGVAAFAAHVCMLAGVPETCAQHFEYAAAGGFARLHVDRNWFWHLCACADVCAYLGDASRAEQLYALIAPHRHLNVVSALHTYRGSAAASLARLSLLLGRREEAAELFETALEFNEKIGARPALVWTQFVYASMLKRGSDPERRRARSLLRDVERGAEDLGVKGLIERFLLGRAKPEKDGVR